MSQADRIRKFVIERYIGPARNSGISEIEIRAGDVHRDMKLVNAMPAICSAIGSSKFEAQAAIKSVARIGPSNGSNARFRFSIQPSPSVMVSPPQIVDPFGRISTCDFADTITLVSCVKSKLSHKAEARDLYTSHLFTGARRVAESSGGRWYILSALYGLVEPHAVIAPYDFTLNSCGVRERREWADRVYNDLMIAEPALRRAVIFAGQRYREFLVPKLLAEEISVEIPMAHLRQGEQLAWLSRRS